MKIILIGFMGTGKTTVAPILAKKLGLNTIEMDDLIVKKAGKSIEQIFKEDGEKTFRELEAQTAMELKDVDNAIISTGGGVITNKNILENLKDNSIIIELFASFDTILKRISPKIPRPLFEDKEEAKELYDYRLPLYKSFASINIATDNKTIDQVVDEIIGKIKI